jgi:hypothetical protein
MAIQYLWERAEESMAHLMGRFQSGGSGCSAAKALTGIEPNRQTQPKFERNQTYHRKDRFGISEKKNISKKEHPHRDLSTSLPRIPVENSGVD